MIIRGLDDVGDWTFGRGRFDYYKFNDAIAQSIESRLRSFLNDCFFDKNSGVDWWNLIGSKNITGINLAVRTSILGTFGVARLDTLEINLDSRRKLTLTYNATTIYNTPLTRTISDLLTEEGDVLVDEYGNRVRI